MNIYNLTPREIDVMRLVVQGKSNKIIAHELGLAEKTAEVHRTHANQKIGGRNPVHTAIKFYRNYMLPEEVE